jgi:hypothetical protein
VVPPSAGVLSPSVHLQSSLIVNKLLSLSFPPSLSLSTLGRLAEFHLSVSVVEHFFLYNHHSSSDDHEVLGRYVAAGLVVHWRVFGSSHHISDPKGLVMENRPYGGRAADAREVIKTIVQPSKIAVVGDLNDEEEHGAPQRSGRQTTRRERRRKRRRNEEDGLSKSTPGRGEEEG